MRLSNTIFLFTLVASLILVGCGRPELASISKSKSVDGRGKLKIVTTFSPLYSLTLNVVGEYADVSNLVPPSTSVHVWEPKPSDVVELSKADILIRNGLSLEAFLDPLIEGAKNDRLVKVTSSQSIATLGVDQVDTIDGVLLADASTVDPHVWLSPLLAVKQVETIRDAVSLIDPLNKDIYFANAEVYSNKLRALDEIIKRDFATVSKKNFILFHDAFQYYLRAYDLYTYKRGVIEAFPGKEPGPQYLKKLIEHIISKEVNIVYTEPQFSPKIVTMLRGDLQVKTYELNPDSAELSSDGYEKMLLLITQTFVSSFNEIS
ncbi:MAG: metal ABC transporter substrate-binding protein [bacterium]